MQLHPASAVTASLQNTPRLSDTVAHLGLQPRARPLASVRVGCCCGQPWWSARTSLASELLFRHGCVTVRLRRDRGDDQASVSASNPDGRVR